MAAPDMHGLFPSPYSSLLPFQSRPQTGDYAVGYTCNDDNVLGNNPKFQPGGANLPGGIGRSASDVNLREEPAGGPVTMAELEE